MCHIFCFNYSFILILLFSFFREDLRRWFINQEVDLFRIRFTSETTEIKKSFMKLNDLNYDEVSYIIFF